MTEVWTLSVLATNAPRHHSHSSVLLSLQRLSFFPRGGRSKPLFRIDFATPRIYRLEGSKRPSTSLSLEIYTATNRVCCQLKSCLLTTHWGWSVPKNRASFWLPRAAIRVQTVIQAPESTLVIQDLDNGLRRRTRSRVHAIPIARPLGLSGMLQHGNTLDIILVVVDDRCVRETVRTARIATVVQLQRAGISNPRRELRNGVDFVIDARCFRHRTFLPASH